MPKIKLPAQSERLIQTSAMFLSIINSTGNFTLESPKFGALVGEVGRQYELQNVNQLTFVNNSDAPLDIEFEIANIKVHTSGKGVVSVSNEIVVKRIVEAIQVNANATVEDGKMAKKVCNIFAPFDHLNATIAAGSTVKVLASREALNRVITIQLITDSVLMGEMRLGDSALNATVNRGIWLQGNKDAPAAFEWETETALYIHNPTNNPITIAGGEQWRT